MQLGSLSEGTVFQMCGFETCKVGTGVWVAITGLDRPDEFLSAVYAIQDAEKGGDKLSMYR